MDGKILPHNKELENELIGRVLLEGQVIHQVFPIITNKEHFYVKSNGFIWDAIASMHLEGASINPLSVVLRLRKEQMLDNAGGAFHLGELSTNASAISSSMELALIVKEYYLKRMLIGLQEKSTKTLYEESSDVFDEMATISVEIERLTNEILKIQEINFYDVIAGRSEELKKAATEKTYKTGEPAYLDPLDRQTNGFQPSDLIILAAVTSMGKTALAIDCARKQAKNHIPVGIFSLEMTSKQLADRMISQESGVDITKLRKAGMNLFDWQNFDGGVSQLVGYPLYVWDKGGASITEICAKAKLWKIKYGIKVLYIDYLQLITPGQMNGRSREQEVASISARLKTLAKELNIPIIALSQLSRKLEDRGDKRPKLSDLRESGAIEQDADLVIFIYRESYYKSDAEEKECELIIAKYRNGKTGTVKVSFVKEFQRFEDVDKFEERGAKDFTQPKKPDDTPF